MFNVVSTRSICMYEILRRKKKTTFVYLVTRAINIFFHNKRHQNFPYADFMLIWTRCFDKNDPCFITGNFRGDLNNVP